MDLKSMAADTHTEVANQKQKIENIKEKHDINTVGLDTHYKKIPEKFRRPKDYY